LKSDRYRRCAEAECNLLSVSHAYCVAHRDYQDTQAVDTVNKMRRITQQLTKEEPQW
jgi:hypothetical protein